MPAVRRLASLFAFLKPASSTDTHADRPGLLLCAEPAYWLYGLLSFCAKACESKIEKANGAPVLRAIMREAPDIEATGRLSTNADSGDVLWTESKPRQAGPPHPPPACLLPSLVHKLVERILFPRVRTPCGRSAQVIIEREGNAS